MNTEMKIVEIDEVAKHIDEAKEMANFLPDVTSEEGYAKSKRVSLDIGKFLTALEKTRKEKKEYFLNGGREVDRQAKLIAEKLEVIQLPHKEAYKEFDELAKKREEDRVEAHRTRLTEIELFPTIHAESDAATLEAALRALNNLSTDGMDEFEARAKTAKMESMHLLKTLQEKALKAEAEAAELQKLREAEEKRKQEEREEAIRKEAAKKAEDEKELALKQKRDAEQAAAIAEERKLQAEKMAKKAKEDAEKAAKKAKEDAEALAIKSEEYRVAAAAQAKKDADDAAEKARKEEIARQEAAKAEEQKIIAKREADQKHIGIIRGEAKDSLIALGIDEAKAKEIVIAIHNGKIKNVKIIY